MKFFRWLESQFTLKTLNKKIFFISKLIALSIIGIHFISILFVKDSKIGIVTVILFLTVIMVGFDLLLHKIVVKPMETLTDISKKMSKLDFTQYSNLHTNDEFESLGNHMNLMADNLKRTLSDLEEANKKLEVEVEKGKILLNQRKELIDQLSHEMKTPLGVIQAYAEGIKDTNDEIKKERYIETVLGASKEITELINNLLDLSALESGSINLKKSEFDLVELIETSIGQLLIDIPEKNFEIKVRLPDEKVFVCLDKDRIKQVINNYIVNAKNHVHDNGVIEVRLDDSEDFIRFSVYNSGDKIDDEEGKYIWNKFYKKRSENKGTGLGLTIVSQLLKLEGIEYGYSNKEKGVEFYFIISK